MRPKKRKLHELQYTEIAKSVGLSDSPQTLQKAYDQISQAIVLNLTKCISTDPALPDSVPGQSHQRWRRR